MFYKTNEEKEINNLNLYLFHVDYNPSIKELWEYFDKDADKYDGLEIPLNLNWHNGRSFSDSKNYYNIRLVAIKKRPSDYFISSYKTTSMTDLKNRYYDSFLKSIGRLIYSQESIKNNDILLFEYINDIRKLKTFKSYKLLEFKIIGIKMVHYDTFPWEHSKFINVIGPKETFFIEE